MIDDTLNIVKLYYYCSMLTVVKFESNIPTKNWKKKPPVSSQSKIT